MLGCHTPGSLVPGARKMRKLHVVLILFLLGLPAWAGVVAISDDGQPVMNSRVMRRAM